MKIQEVILKAMAGKLKWWEEALHKRSRRSLERRLRPSGVSPKGITLKIGTSQKTSELCRPTSLVPSKAAGASRYVVSASCTLTTEPQ